MPRRSLVEDLRGRARRAVAQNAALLNVSGRGMTIDERARRFYDVPAKIAVAERIAAEEFRRAGDHHNDAVDAQRHARWSERTAEAAGPLFAEAAGLAHEAENMAKSIRYHGLAGPYDDDGPPTPGQTLDEIRMDLRNNAEGRRAAREGREIDPATLQAAPATPPMSALYRSPLAAKRGFPPR